MQSQILRPNLGALAALVIVLVAGAVLAVVLLGAWVRKGKWRIFMR